MRIGRRAFLSGLTAGALTPIWAANAPRLERSQVAFITDEYSQDLGEAIEFAREFNLEQVEIRSVDGDYGFMLPPEKLQEIRRRLDDAGLRVCCLSTPILKCVAPGFEPIERVAFDLKMSLNSFPVPHEEQFERSEEFTRRAVEACDILGTDAFRVFSFWRTADPNATYPLLAEKLAQLSEIAAGKRLALENEHACNVADCAEAVAAIGDAPGNVGLLWDVLNGVSTGETPYPNGYKILDPDRIFHVQLKDADLSKGVERFHYTAVGEGDIPYAQIFEALARDGYQGAVSMETHFAIDGSKKDASRRSMRGVLEAIQAS